MLKDLRLGLLLLLVLLPATASATTRHYEGCFVCDFILPTGSQAECSQVGDGENGTGWQWQRLKCGPLRCRCRS